MSVSFILKFLLISGGMLFAIAVIYRFLYPIYKIKQIKRQTVLQCNLNRLVKGRNSYVNSYPWKNCSWDNLPLGELGVSFDEFEYDFSYRWRFNRRRFKEGSYWAKTIIPVLTDSGELLLPFVKNFVAREPSGIGRAIFLKLLQASRTKVIDREQIDYTKACKWHYEGVSSVDVHIPVLAKLSSVDKVRYRAAQELAPLIKVYCELETEIMRIGFEREKVQRLLKLIARSDVHTSQQNVYETAYSEMSELMSKARELKQLYSHLIRKLLTDIQIATNYPAMLSGNQLSVEAIETQYREQKEEYEYMKDKIAAYADLLNEQQV